MAYLDNSEIIVDAILTKKGREKLAAGQALNITQFALGDDEIDYELYDSAHPKGSAYYDSAIRAIPILEASPDETQNLRYKLVTLPKGTVRIPQVSLGITEIKTNQNLVENQLKELAQKDVVAFNYYCPPLAEKKRLSKQMRDELGYTIHALDKIGRAHV